MLTNDLLRYNTDAKTIKPRYLKRKHAPYYLNIAQDLIDIYAAHVGKTRGELEKELDRYENTSVNYKIQRGLAKILDGFAEFETGRDFDYPNYRQKLFEAVERHRPVVRQPDLVHDSTREKVLQKIGDDLGALPRSLYGDLPEHARLERFKRMLSPHDLVKRYNLALAQGVLYRSIYMEFTLEDSFKTVFQYLKLAQLMHRVAKEGDGYHIEVDGPFSLFRKTQKYGVNLARFLPGLLLAEDWRMTAHINTPEGRRFFSLDHDCGLSSHYKQGNPFDSALEEAFYRGFKKRQTEWEIQRETELLDLGDSVFIPDFKFVHPDGRTALLEIIGFWTPEYLSKKLDKLKRANRQDLIVAVNEKLNCSKSDFSGPVIFIKTRLKVGEVLKILGIVRDSHGRRGPLLGSC